MTLKTAGAVVDDDIAVVDHDAGVVAVITDEVDFNRCSSLD